MFDSAQLDNLLGRSLTYQGIPCQVIDILEEGPALVLQCAERIIQADQYGEARRRVPRTFTVSVLNVRRDGFNPLLPELPDLLA